MDQATKHHFLPATATAAAAAAAAAVAVAVKFTCEILTRTGGSASATPARLNAVALKAFFSTSNRMWWTWLGIQLARASSFPSDKQTGRLGEASWGLGGVGVAGFGVGAEGVLLACTAVILRPFLTVASLHCRDGARRAFTDQADIACTKRV